MTLSFSQWERNSRGVEISIGNLLSPEALANNNGGKPLELTVFLAETNLLEIMHAELALAYGYHYDNLYTKSLIESLQRCSHSFGFIRLDGPDRKTGLKIVIIKLRKGSVPDHFREKFRISKGTILEAQMRIDSVENVDKPLKADLQVAENSLAIDFGSADVVAYVKRISLPQEMFTENSFKYLILPRKYFADIFKEKLNNEGHDRALNAIHELFGEIDRKKPDDLSANMTDGGI